MASERRSRTEAGGGPRIQSVARAASILAGVAESARGMTAREISAAQGLRMPTTYHQLHQLESVGLVRRDPTGSRYLMGFAVGALASGLDRHMSSSEALVECLRAVVAKTGETAYGSCWADDEIVTLARISGTRPVRVADVPLGLRSAAHASASGKLLLALATDEVRTRYLERRPPMSLTDNTLDERSLVSELEEIPVRGFATDLEEAFVGVCSVAVPYTVADRIHAIALSAPTERFRANSETLLDALMNRNDSGDAAIMQPRFTS